MKLRYALLPLSLLTALPVSAATRGLDVRDMVALDRVSAPLLTADGGSVVFAKRVMGADSKASTGLFIRNLRTRDAAPPKPLTPAGWNVSSAALSADGSSVYFLSARNGSQQLYVMPVAGGAPRQLTDFPVDVDSYQLSPQGDRVAFSAGVFQDCGSDLACTEKKLAAHKARKNTGEVFDSMFVRHWDTWNDGRRNTLFVAPLPAGKVAPVKGASAISATLAGDAPSKPFGGNDDFTWAPDGKSLVASIRVAGPKEPWSTNFDLYRLDAEGKQAPVNLTAANPAWDAGPVFSADGATLFYRAMKRPGFEADRFGVMAMDLATGKVREIAPQWDRSAGEVVLSADGNSFYTAADDLGEHRLFNIDIATGKATVVAEGGSIGSPVIAGNTLAYTKNSLKSGDQIVVAQADGSTPREITPSASQMLPDVAVGDYEQLQFKGWNNETLHR